MSPLKMKVYDVEYGSCSHIITPNGKHILIDLGSKSDKSICKHLKENYFVNGSTIDGLILTHLHEDHIHDLPRLDTYGINPRVLTRPARAFDLSYRNSDPEYYKEVVRKANQLNATYTNPVSDSESPYSAGNNGGVNFEFFTPAADQYSSDPNSYSNVIVITYERYKIIVTGDNPADILRGMLKRDTCFSASIRDADILIAPHHGRDGEFCEEFVTTVNPLITVFSDGTKKYETQSYSLAKYANKTRGVNWEGQKRNVFTTRSDGTITFGLHAEGGSIGTSKTEY